MRTVGAIVILTLLLSAPMAKGREYSASKPDSDLYGKILHEIRISGLRITRRDVVLRQLASKVGRIYLEENVANDRSALDRLGIFSSFEIQGRSSGDGVILDVKVKETSPYLPILSLSVTEENGTSLGPGIKSVNLLGSAASLSAAMRFGNGTSIEVRSEGEWLGRFHFPFDVWYLRTDRFDELNDFNEVSHEAGFRLGRYLGHRARLGGLLTFLALQSDVEGVTLSNAGTDRVPALGVYLGYDGRDTPSNPHRGWWTEAEVSKAGGFLGGRADFWSLVLDVRRYQPLTERQNLVFFSLATLRTGELKDHIPGYLEFDLGGMNTIRGWELGAEGGKNQFINTVEYRYLLMRPRSGTILKFTGYLGLELAAFADVGSAWSESSRFSKSFIGGYGVGVRLLVPFVDVIRFDVGMGQEGLGVSFHVGILKKPVMSRRRIR